MRRIVVVLALSVLPALTAGPAQADGLSFEDPAGDDDGHGKVVYPTDPVYEKGAFDLRGLAVKDLGDTVEIETRFARKLTDPWRSKEWDGNGFSLQMVFVFVDTTPGAGRTDAPPGLNVGFGPAAAWDKVVLLSPQPAGRLRSEIGQKAASMAADIVIPVKTRVSGKAITAVVAAKDLGGRPAATWGWQALVQSNEGYPSEGDLLTRKINEYEGPHRFGGGSDFDCDPHVLDMLAPPGKGGDAEKDAQHRALSAYTCDAAGAGTRAVVPMVVPGR